MCEGHIPTLDEVLDLIKGKAHLLLEIKYSKHSREGIEEMCLKCIEEHQAGSFVTIQSFDDSVLKKVHDLNPDISLEKLFFSYSRTPDCVLTKGCINSVLTTTHMSNHSMSGKAG